MKNSTQTNSPAAPATLIQEAIALVEKFENDRAYWRTSELSLTQIETLLISAHRDASAALASASKVALGLSLDAEALIYLAQTEEHDFKAKRLVQGISLRDNA